MVAGLVYDDAAAAAAAAEELAGYAQTRCLPEW